MIQTETKRKAINLKTSYTQSYIAALFAAFIQFSAIDAKSQGVTGPTITGERWLGPTYPTQAQINSLIQSEMLSSTTANGWQYVPDGAPVNIEDIFDPNGNGNSLYYTLDVNDPSGTTLGQTLVAYSALDAPYTMTFDQAGVSYTGQGVGISASGTQYWSGNADTPITSFYVIGASTDINIGNETVQQALDFWKAGFSESVQYSSSWGAITMNTLYVAPEPTSMDLLLISGAVMSVCTFLKCRSAMI